MCRAQAWPTWKTPATLVCNSRSKASAGKSSSGARNCMPALFTRMSIGPTPPRTRPPPPAPPHGRSRRTPAPRAPAERLPPPRPASPASRPFSTTVAPAAASPRASASPIPCVRARDQRPSPAQIEEPKPHHAPRAFSAVAGSRAPVIVVTAHDPPPIPRGTPEGPCSLHAIGFPNHWRNQWQTGLHCAAADTARPNRHPQETRAAPGPGGAERPPGGGAGAARRCRAGSVAEASATASAAPNSSPGPWAR